MRFGMILKSIVSFGFSVVLYSSCLLESVV